MHYLFTTSSLPFNHRLLPSGVTDGGGRSGALSRPIFIQRAAERRLAYGDASQRLGGPKTPISLSGCQVVHGSELHYTPPVLQVETQSMIQCCLARPTARALPSPCPPRARSMCARLAPPPDPSPRSSSRPSPCLVCVRASRCDGMGSIIPSPRHACLHVYVAHEHDACACTGQCVALATAQQRLPPCGRASLCSPKSR